MMKVVRRVLIFFAILALVLVGTVLWMAKGLQRAHTFAAPPQQVSGVHTTTSTGTDTLRVVVWNLSWAYGWGSEGSGSAKPAEHFEQTLEKMGAVLRKVSPDLILMQEVDLGASRSFDTNQAEALARAVGLPWMAEAVSWEANYLPFPYWPPKDHFGRVRSGGAILSRFPITKNVIELYPKPEENSFVYNMGYLFRYLQHAEIELRGQSVPIFNAHLDAFSSKNRQAHAGHISRRLTTEMHPWMIFGADMNTVPPESSVRSGYPDEPTTAHDDDISISRLRAVEGLRDTLNPDDFVAHEADYFTFPAQAPNRKLDFIFAGSGYEVVSFRVLKEAGELSDHLPVFAELRLRPQ